MDRKKGVNHINATDEVTQFEVVITVERISELLMLSKPAIGAHAITQACKGTASGYYCVDQAAAQNGAINDVNAVTRQPAEISSVRARKIANGFFTSFRFPAKSMRK